MQDSNLHLHSCLCMLYAANAHKATVPAYDVPDAKVLADLCQLLCCVIRVEQVDTAAHIPPQRQLGITSEEQPPLADAAAAAAAIAQQ